MSSSMRCFLLLPITSHGPKIPFNPLLGPVQVHGGTNRRDGPRRFVLEKSIFADGRWTPRPRATLELPSRRSKPEPPCCAATATDCTVPGTKQPSRVFFSCPWSTFTGSGSFAHRQTHVSETKLGASGLDVLLGLVRPSLLHSLRVHTHMSAGGLAGLPRRRLHSSSAYLLLVEEDVGRVLPLLADVRAARLADLGVVEGEPAVRRLARVVARVNAVADVVA